GMAAVSTMANASRARIPANLCNFNTAPNQRRRALAQPTLTLKSNVCCAQYASTASQTYVSGELKSNAASAWSSSGMINKRVVGSSMNARPLLNDSSVDTTSTSMSDRPAFSSSSENSSIVGRPFIASSTASANSVSSYLRQYSRNRSPS